MSGSLVLRRGVGTQMLMVSRSVTDGEIGGRLDQAFIDQRLQHRGRDVLNIGLAAIQAVHFRLVDIDSSDGKSGVRQLHGERQADVTQSDDAGPGVSAFQSSGATAL